VGRKRPLVSKFLVPDREPGAGLVADEGLHNDREEEDI
jgi:hypothetical protein